MNYPELLKEAQELAAEVGANEAYAMMLAAVIIRNAVGELREEITALQHITRRI